MRRCVLGSWRRSTGGRSSNNGWYALDGEYPYLALVKRVYDMKRVSLRQRGPAWMIDL